MDLPSILGPPITDLKDNSFLPSAIGGGSDTSTLNFTMQRQLQTNWCWSAVSTSVSLFYNMASSWTQCNLVNAELELSTCCDDGTTSNCNKPWFLDRALQRTANLLSWNQGTLTERQIELQLAGDSPIGVRIGWNGNSGHFVVISGISSSNNISHLTIEDPWNGQSTYEYSRFLTRYNGTGKWTHTYLTKS